jgi:hypothetical protein
MVAGDLVVVIIVGGLTATSAEAVNNAGGQSWSSRADMTGANNIDFQMFWCQFNGTWSANPSFTIAAESGTIPISVIMHVFRPDAAGTWAVDQAFTGGSEASASPVVITGVTNTHKDTVTLAGCGIRAAAPTWGSVSGSGWTATGTAQYRNTNGTDLSCTFAHRLAAASGASGDVSITPSGAAAGASFIASWWNSLVPTISPNTTDATNFGADSTPTLEFTGTDGNADDLRYNFHVDTVNTFDSQVGTPLELDSYSEANNDTPWAVLSAQTGVGQSFHSGGGGRLLSAKFYLSKNTGATGNAVAKIYAHSGTFGTSSVPTGSALAVSDNFDVSTLTTSLALTTLNFSGANQISLSPSTDYVLTIEYSGATQINVGADNSSPTHEGNGSQLTGAWAAGARDTCFYIYIGSPLLNKLSGTDSGFANTVTGGDTDPFNSGEKVSFTVQAGDALADGTYYWRARCIDPNGSNTYSSWTTVRSFTILSAFNARGNTPILQGVKRSSTF